MPDCSACAQMKLANKELRKALMDTNKNYTEVVNENLYFRRLLIEAGIYHGETP